MIIEIYFIMLVRICKLFHAFTVIQYMVNALVINTLNCEKEEPNHCPYFTLHYAPKIGCSYIIDIIQGK